MCAGNTYTVDICLQYPATLAMPPCDYQFPVDTCVSNSFLLGKDTLYTLLLISTRSCFRQIPMWFQLSH